MIEFNEWLTQDAGTAADKGGLGVEVESSQVQLVRTDRLPDSPHALTDLAARALLIPAAQQQLRPSQFPAWWDGLCTLCARSVGRAELRYEAYATNLMKTLVD